MKTTTKQRLERFRHGVRRIQLGAGIGFLSFVLGSLLVAWAVPWFDHVRQNAHSAVLPWVVWIVLSNLWVAAVLPLVAYGFAKVADLAPWPTALLAVATGEAFYLALESLLTLGQSHDEGLGRTLSHLGGLGAGLVLTKFAIARARTGRSAADGRAQAAAAAKEQEYEAFRLEAQRLAERAGPEAGTQASPPPSSEA